MTTPANAEYLRKHTTYRREEAWMASAEALIRARLPLVAKFGSWTRQVSPIGNLMLWVDAQAGQKVFPNDVLIHVTDMSRLREEQRRWLRRAFGLRGKRLESTLDFTDIGGAPITARWLVKPGEVLIRQRAATP